MVTSEAGRYEIEAAKQRLAAATEQATSAEKSVQMAEATLASAKAMLDHAQSQRQSSKKEVDAAKRALREGEERWQVIDVDASSTADLPQANNKKRKAAALSPGTTATAGGAVARASSATNSNNVGEYPVPQRTARPNPPWAQPRASAAGQPRATAVTTAGRHVILSRSGLSIVDGVYRETNATSGGAPIYQKEQGDAPPTEIQYKIYCKRGFWYIGHYPAGGAYYRTLEKVKDSEINNSCPPVRDWISTRSGYYMPVPKIGYGNSNGTATIATTAAARKSPPGAQRTGQNPFTNYANMNATSSINVTSVIVKGAGLSEVNGSYSKSNSHHYSGAPPVYCKPSVWKGKSVEFILSLRLDNGGWSISVRESNSLFNLTPDVTLYEVYCYSYPIQETPPCDGWLVCKGSEPAPTLQLKSGSRICTIHAQPYIHGISKLVVSSNQPLVYVQPFRANS